VGHAKVAINSTIAQLLGVAGEQIAARRQRAIEAVENDLSLLRGLAQSPGAVIGPAASDTLRGDAMTAGYHPADTSRWTALAEKLKGDPEAPLSLD
jgi:hypothetical protein